MYHHVNPHRGDTVTVTPEVFERHMKHLRDGGYRTLTAEELLRYIKGELNPGQRAVVITFDDGWLDNYLYVFPVLKKYQLNASVFVITGRIERASAKMTAPPGSVPTHNESKMLIRNGEEHNVVLTWRLIEEMAGSGLVDFYSHTKTHKKCDTLSEGELLEELGESREVIEERLGRRCLSLCWPYGKYNEDAVRAARDLGYEALFTTDHGVVKAGSSPFAIKRIVVKDREGWFEKRMNLYTNSLLSALYLAIKSR
jgi:peptidoglycan/xylan/chitin deacetylase (PgdA/CDA1 family)